MAVLEAPRQPIRTCAGAPRRRQLEQVDGVLSVVNPLLSYDQWKKVKEMWNGVKEAWVDGRQESIV
jgi:hypothetical protein